MCYLRRSFVCFLTAWASFCMVSAVDAQTRDDNGDVIDAIFLLTPEEIEALRQKQDEELNILESDVKGVTRNNSGSSSDDSLFSGTRDSIENSAGDILGNDSSGGRFGKGSSSGGGFGLGGSGFGQKTRDGKFDGGGASSGNVSKKGKQIYHRGKQQEKLVLPTRVFNAYD